MPNAEEQAAYVAGLRALADHLEAHPKLIPNLAIRVDCFAYDRTSLAELTRHLGKAEKVDDGNYLVLRRRFGPHCLELNAPKESTCEKVPTGRKVTRKVTAGWVEIVEDEYEWKCPDSILAAQS